MVLSEIKYLRQLVPVLLTGAVVGAVGLFNLPSRQEALESSADLELPVRVSYVQKVSAPEKLRFTGELQPTAEAAIVARLAGKVSEVRFRVGDWVPAGAIVATIRANDLEQRIATLERTIAAAKTELRTREDQLAQAEKKLAEVHEYLRRELIARNEAEQFESAAETARAQNDLARAHLAQQEAMLAQVQALRRLTVLTAPISGTVSRRLMESGAIAREGEVIMVIMNLDSLKLNAKVNEGGELNLEGRAVQIMTPDLRGVILEGKVARLEPRQDEEGAAEIEVRISNREKKLRPGMTVEASIDSKTADEILIVPSSAVVSEGGTSYVYKVSGNRTVRQPVVVVRKRSDGATIVGGLKEGDPIVIEPAHVRSDLRVRAVNSSSDRAQER
jgi:RND family efflux transporter MFP subunit